MITEADVRNALKDTIHSDGAASWSADFNFCEGALDSLDHVTFLLALQESHGFSFQDEDVPKLNTIQAVLDFAASKSSS